MKTTSSPVPANVAQHTPTPWKLRTIDNALRGEICYVIGGTPTHFIADCGFDVDGAPTRSQANANASFIVRACNAHEELVAQMRNVEAVAAKNAEHGSADWAFIRDTARAALAKAKQG